MNDAATALSTERDTVRAARDIAEQVRRAMRGAAPDAMMVFASAEHPPQQLLETLADLTGCSTISGASSAGEFVASSRGEGAVSVLALRSDEMKFSVGLGKGVAADPIAAARQAAKAFTGIESSAMRHRAALVMTDALAGHADAIVEELTVLTGGSYRFFGGGAGDDGHFKQTHVFAGREAATDAVAALEILSERPIGIGVSHGWTPAGEPLRVTEASGARVSGLNGMPAVEAIEAHARATGQAFDRAAPLPFFLHNILGIQSASQYRLRVPLAVTEDGALLCAADVPEGSIVRIMKTSESSAVLAASRATRSALQALGGAKPKAAVVFDCVATRLRMGRAFEDELKACAELLQPAGLAGCNTYGQIARAEGQFGGFHNCTAVVCVLPE